MCVIRIFGLVIMSKKELREVIGKSSFDSGVNTINRLLQDFNLKCKKWGVLWKIDLSIKYIIQQKKYF